MLSNLKNWKENWLRRLVFFRTNTSFHVNMCVMSVWTTIIKLISSIITETISWYLIYSQWTVNGRKWKSNQFFAVEVNFFHFFPHHIRPLCGKKIRRNNCVCARVFVLLSISTIKFVVFFGLMKNFDEMQVMELNTKDYVWLLDYHSSDFLMHFGFPVACSSSFFAYFDCVKR